MATAHTNFSAVGPDADLAAEFILSAEVGDPTRQKYRTHLVAFADWLREHGTTDRISQAQPADVQRFMSSLRAADRQGGALSPATRRNYLASLRSFYRYCVEVQLVDRDPSASAKLPKLERKPGVFLSADELRQLMSVRTTPRERVQIHLMVYTGARAGELLSLRWKDVDFNARTILLSGKGGKSRELAVHPVLASELRKWFVHQEIAAERSAAIAAARRDPATDFVLMTRTGKPVRRSTLYRQLKRCAFLAGLYPLEANGKEYRSAVSPHALRRSFATLLLNDGHPIDAVADVLGHASLDTTRSHYAFSSTARQRHTVEALPV